MRKLAVLVGAGMVLGIFAQALAQEDAPKAPRPRMGFAERLKRMDTDGDGKISADEWKGREEQFKRLDADGDGFIGKAEMKKMAGGRRPQRTPRLAPIFILADADKDGKLSREELQAVVGKLMKSDANGDGFVDAVEFQKATAEAAVQAFFKMQDKNGDGEIGKDEWRGKKEQFDKMDADGSGGISIEEFKKARTQMRPGGRRPGGAAQWFARMDKDNDGKVTKEEFTGKDQMFDRLDANGDGAIDKDEAGKMRRRPGGGGPRGPRRRRAQPEAD